MLELYFAPTPNGWKTTIMLEECGLDYELKLVNIGSGEQFKEPFLSLSPKMNAEGRKKRPNCLVSFHQTIKKDTKKNLSP